jgi:hypothetical protein
MKKILSLLCLIACFSMNIQAQCPTSIEQAPISVPVPVGSFYTFHLVSIAECALYYPTNTVIQIGGQNFGVQDCYDNGTVSSPDVVAELRSETVDVPLSTLPNPFILTIGGVTCSFANPMGATTVLLPIELVSFEGKALEKSNLLTWRTASEKNNNGFDIERSTDGSRFEKIGFVAGNGTTSQTQRYTFNDVSFPFGEGRDGAVYYRLKQLDFDGRFEYSKTIAITRKAKDAVSVYPNPTEGILNISADDYEQAFELVNHIGQVVLQGEQLDKTINLQALPNGFYYLKVGTQTMKVVKE